jgi:geranylgeranyl reductase family protein
MYDVAIIGAGPAGSAAAHFLAQQGLKVLLLDKFDFPRDKTCGDAMLPRALNVIKDMGLLPEVLRLGHRVNKLDIFAPRGHSTLAPIPAQPEWPNYTLVIPRLILDDIIRQRALASGAQFQSPIHVTGLEQDPAGVTVKGGRQGRSVAVKAKLAIIATGASPKLLLQLGLLKQMPCMLVAARAYFEGVQDVDDLLHLRFDGVPLPGYGWIFPLPDGSANVGAGFLPKAGRTPATPAAAFEAFIQIRPIQNMLAQAKQTGPVKGYPLRTDFATAPTYAERILLVGEAAGLVNPLTGEGIDYALESGRIAAEHVAAMFASGDFSVQRLIDYDRSLRQQFQRLFVTCNWMRDWFINRPMLNRLVSVSNRRADLRLMLINLVLGHQDLVHGLPRLAMLKALFALATP